MSKKKENLFLISLCSLGIFHYIESDIYLFPITFILSKKIADLLAKSSSGCHANFALHRLLKILYNSLNNVNFILSSLSSRVGKKAGNTRISQDGGNTGNSWKLLVFTGKSRT